MTALKFNIEYKTQWGEELFVSGSISQLGGLDENEALKLSTTDGVNWSSEIHLDSIDKEPLEYYYFVRKNGHNLRREITPNRMLMLSDNAEYSIRDYWKLEIYHTYLYNE